MRHYHASCRAIVVTSITILTGILISQAVLSNPVNHHRYVEIEVGEGSGSNVNATRDRNFTKHYNHNAHQHDNGPIRDRLRRLEMAMRELQQEVWELRRENDRLKSQQHRYACYIKTPFDGTFLGRGTTRIEATAIALNQCEAKAQSWCKEQRVKCEKA